MAVEQTNQYPPATLLGRLLLCVLILAAVARSETVKILFIGNSYTYYYSLPGLLEALAEATRPDVDVVIRYAYSPSLEYAVDRGLQHRRGELLSLSKVLDADKWDYVVLQEQSALNDYVYSEGVLRPLSAEKFWTSVRAIHEHLDVPGAQLVLYNTWAPRAAPQDQALIDYAYMTIAKEIGASVAPVGPAFAEARRAPMGVPVDLYGYDGRHPSPAGTYLAACVLYAAIFGRSPDELPRELEVPVMANGVTTNGEISVFSIPAKQALMLQAVAWRVHESVESGAYRDIERPEAAQLPWLGPIVLETGMESVALHESDDQLEGLWVGTLRLETGPARMEAEFTQ